MPSTTSTSDRLNLVFQTLWKDLFSSPVHLDSALSKQSKSMKSLLAQITPVILLRPVSSAQALGIGVPEGQPWSLPLAELAEWRPAQLMAERIYAAMEGGRLRLEAEPEDYPPHMRQEWEKSWGPALAQSLVRILAQDPPLSLRASRKIGAEELERQFKKSGTLPVKSQCSEFAPLGLRLAGYAPILNTELYEKGSFEIQDEGSQVMALFALWPEKFAALLKSEPGPVLESAIGTLKKPELGETQPWTIVDACAGAGGKSLALADAIGGKGRVFAYDTAPAKLKALRRRSKNAGLNNIQTVEVVEGSESVVVSRFRARADVVLVDAPCSGWGVLRRNPDIKWRQGRDVLERMPGIQKRLLSEYAALVRPGGRLVFGVCTFRDEETRAVVRHFLKEHPQFTEGEGGYLGPGPCDGFFMQSFERSGK